jgi:HK97 family phage prohead protease
LLYLTTPLELVEIKAGSDGPEFTAYASTFNNTDLGGDIIRKGAFTASLRERKWRPLLWQHDMREPIGIEKSLKEDGKGLIGTWQLADTQRGRDAHTLLKQGAVRSMSIGFIPHEFKFDDQGETRILERIDLLENSVVSLPMNEQARVTSVKHLDGLEMLLDALENAAAKREKPNKNQEDAEPKSYSDLTLADHASLLTEIAGAFGERTNDLLKKLSAGGYELTDAKRNDLHVFLETFSSLDAVRSDAETLLRDTTTPDPSTHEAGGLALAIELRRRRLRLHTNVET